MHPIYEPRSQSEQIRLQRRLEQLTGAAAQLQSLIKLMREIGPTGTSESAATECPALGDVEPCERLTLKRTSHVRLVERSQKFDAL